MKHYIILDGKTISFFEKLMTEQSVNMLRKQEDFFAIGAISDDTACGYMICETTEEGYIIHDIFVHPDFRRRGIGRGLVENLIYIAYPLMEDIDCYFIEKEDDSLRLLLESMNLFEIECDESTGTYEVSLDDLSKSPFLKPFKGMTAIENSCLDFYNDFLPMERKSFIAGNPSIKTTAVNISPDKDDITKYCFIATDSSKSDMVAYIKVNDGGDSLHIEGLWYKQGHEKNLMAMLIRTLQMAVEDGNYKTVRTCVVDDNVLEFFKRFAPGAKQLGQGYSAWWNYKLPE